MRACVPSYQLIHSPDLSSALEMLAREPGVWRPFAGGTDLMVLLEAGKLPHKNYLNIWNLKELRGIEVTDQHVTLGGLTTYTEVQQEKLLQKEFPMLCQAASETGGLAIQNRGTLGGNVVNASPAADSPPALLAYDAEIELVSSGGSRWLSYDGFHTGYKQMGIRPDELLSRIRLPRTGPIGPIGLVDNHVKIWHFSQRYRNEKINHPGPDPRVVLFIRFSIACTGPTRPAATLTLD